MLIRKHRGLCLLRLESSPVQDGEILLPGLLPGQTTGLEVY